MANPNAAESENPFDQLMPTPIAASSGASAPQESNPFDDLMPTPVSETEQSSATGAFARSAERGAVPALGSLPAIGAGATIGAAIGPTVATLGLAALAGGEAG